MNEIIHQVFSMPPPFNMVVVIVAVVMGTGVITSVAGEIRKYASHRESMEVIRDLAERGMSAAEIERILNAGPGSHHINQNVRQA
jgi:hypothetical protein